MKLGEYGFNDCLTSEVKINSINLLCCLLVALMAGAVTVIDMDLVPVCEFWVGQLVGGEDSREGFLGPQFGRTSQFCEGSLIC